MATPKWEPGKLYPPGSLVVPRSSASSALPAIANGGFEDGSTGWTLPAGMTVASDRPFSGMKSLLVDGVNGLLTAVYDPSPVTAGTKITAKAMRNQGGASKGNNVGWVLLKWLDADGNLLKESEGNKITSSKSNAYHQTSVTDTAPSGTASVSVALRVQRNSPESSNFDDVSWSLVSSPTPGIMYRATQASAGYSATTEPAWPPNVGETVIDNEVTWEGVLMSRIVWEANAILVSGENEPDWPGEIGTSVSDNTISWTAVNPATLDANCPQSKIVAIAKFKVYAGDGDVVRYTATLNPQDWSSEKDAGYLGTGLQQNGANRVALLNLYRANLVVMNATTFQQWQIDPDPSLMDLLDTMDGIGSIWHLAAQPVSNDLFYLSNRGVRTVGMSGTTNNLKAGDVGLPVDEMVRALVSELVETNNARGNENLQPIGLYLPSMGQYWLAFNREVNPDDTSTGAAIDVCPGLAENDTPVDPEIWYTDEITLSDQSAADDAELQFAYLPWYRNDDEADSAIEIGSYILSAEVTFTIKVDSEVMEEHTISAGITSGESAPIGTQETGEEKTYTVTLSSAGFKTSWASSILAIAVTSTIGTRTITVSNISAIYTLSDRASGAARPPRKYSEVMVYTLTQVGQVGAWSRYIFPFPIDAWAQEGDDLYARDGNTVYRISEDIGCRDRWSGVESGESAYWERFDAIIQWPWLDMGPPGIDKQMEDFDVVGYGGVEVEVGYDQTEPGYFTEPYPVVADTLRGTTIPMPLTSPSYSVRLRYRGMLGVASGDTPAPDAVYNRTWGFNAMRINFT